VDHLPSTITHLVHLQPTSVTYTIPRPLIEVSRGVY